MNLISLRIGRVTGALCVAKRWLFVLCLVISALTHGQAQSANVLVLMDDYAATKDFYAQYETEVRSLLESRFNLNLRTVFVTPSTVDSEIVKAFQSDSDVIVTLGILVNSKIEQRNAYPIPTLAAISLEGDRPLKTNIENYSFIQSPFDFGADMERFSSLVSIKKLGILVHPIQKSFVESYVSGYDFPEIEIDIIPSSGNVENDMNMLPEDLDGMYVFPYTYADSLSNQQYFDALVQKKLPSFAMLGRNIVERGVLAGRASSEYVDVFARKLALNTMRALEGENPSEFETSVTGVEEEFVINIKTLRAIGVYPPFDVMAEGLLIELDYTSNGRSLTLHGAILEAMENNLDIQIARADVLNQEQQVRVANANRLPQLDFSTSTNYIDPSISRNSLLVDELAWVGNLSFRQLIYSEPVYANVAIQKYLESATQEALSQTQLEIYQNTASVYLNYLLAQTNVKIQQQNVEVTHKNLNLAKTRVEVGQSSAADIYRLEAQLANNYVSLNDALTQLQIIKFQLNVLLNRPKNEDIQAEDIELTVEYLVLADPRLQRFIESQYQVQMLSDFLVQHAEANAPSLGRIDYSINAAERNLQANQRSLFVPQIGVGAGWMQTWGRYLEGSANIDEMQNTLGPLYQDPLRDQWQAQLTVSLPIFQGFARNANIQASRVQLNQLETQRANASQFLEANIRSSLENVANSYGDVQLTQQAADAAVQYLYIVQDLYSEGAVNLTNLLEAQTNAVASQLAAAAARYQLLMNGIALETATAFPSMLASPEEKESFINAYIEFLLNQED